MIVSRLAGYKEVSPFRNLSVLAGDGEKITGDEDFAYALEIPWENPPVCLLTEHGLRTTLLEMVSINSKVGELKITPLKESDPNLPSFARTPMTTIRVAELLELREKTSLIAELN